MRASLAKNSAWSQLLVLLSLCILSSIVLYSIAFAFIPLFFGVDLNALLSMLGEQGLDKMPLAISRYIQGLSSIIVFLVPALLIGFFISKEPKKFLASESFPNYAGFAFAISVIIGLSSPGVSDLFFRLSLAIPWPSFMDEYIQSLLALEELNVEAMSSFLVMESFGDFMYLLFLMAVLPAICEETFFRGALLGIFNKGFKNETLAVVFSAFAFSIMHAQLNAFLSIFVLGIVLAYLRIWTKSIWPGVIVHFINNGLIVFGVYFFEWDYSEQLDTSSNESDILLNIFSVAVLGLVLFFVYKKYNNWKEQGLNLH